MIGRATEAKLCDSVPCGAAESGRDACNTNEISARAAQDNSETEPRLDIEEAKRAKLFHESSTRERTAEDFSPCRLTLAQIVVGEPPQKLVEVNLIKAIPRHQLILQHPLVGGQRAVST